MKKDYLSADDAAEYLGVKRATLYAYASRGLLQSINQEGTRGSWYLRSDLDRVKSRKDARSGHGPVAAAAMRFGEPILESALCSITPESHTYRGHSAVELAREGVPFESICMLLWTGELPLETVRFSLDDAGFPAARVAQLLPRDCTALSAVAAALPVMAAADEMRLATTPGAELARAKSLVMRIAGALCLARDPHSVDDAISQPTVARAFLVAMGMKPSPRAESAVQQALVLMADHELNPSSFAARVAAGTGADLYACVSSALGTFSGPKHGGACDQTEALLAETQKPERAREVLLGRTRRGEAIPGFGHVMYPAGDPRTPVLLKTALDLAPRNPSVRTLIALVEAMDRGMHLKPTADVGVVGLCHALGLPGGAATALFALGRSAGWIAHALEQRAQNFTIRPRARYTGPGVLTG